MYIKCMDIFFNILVAFLMFQGNCKNLLEYLMLFYIAPSVCGINRKKFGDQVRKKEGSIVCYLWPLLNLRRNLRNDCS